MTLKEAVSSLRAYADGYAGNIRGMCAEAGDMLEELDKRVPRWISVEERLPDESEDLVLIVASGRHKNIVFDKALLLGVYYDDSGWIIEGYTEWEDAHVTHWMPLPEPPEEGEE